MRPPPLLLLVLVAGGCGVATGNLASPAIAFGGRRALQDAGPPAVYAPATEGMMLDLPPDLNSLVPFYAALLQPALAPFLPVASDSMAGSRQQALEELAAKLAPVVESALNQTMAQLELLLAEVESLLPANASDAEMAAIEADPAFWEDIAGTLNATTEELTSTLTAASQGAGQEVYALLSSQGRRLAPLASFLTQFVPAFVSGLTKGVLDAVTGNLPDAESILGGTYTGRRLQKFPTSDQQTLEPSLGLWAGPEAAGSTRSLLAEADSYYAGGTVVGCVAGPSGDQECQGYRVEGTSPQETIAYAIPAPEAEQIASGLAGQAATVGGTALQAGLLAGAGAVQAASAILQAASADLLQAQLMEPGSGRRRDLLVVGWAPAPEAEAVLAPAPEAEQAMDVLGQQESAASQVVDAIAEGTKAATTGIETAGNAAGAAVGGAANVAAATAEAANRLALAAVQSGAQVVAAVQQLIGTGSGIGQAVSG